MALQKSLRLEGPSGLRINLSYSSVGEIFERLPTIFDWQEEKTKCSQDAVRQW
jgi:hypothetical protein